MDWAEIGRDEYGQANRWECGEWIIQQLFAPAYDYPYPYEVRRLGEVRTYCRTLDDARVACGDTIAVETVPC